MFRFNTNTATDQIAKCPNAEDSLTSGHGDGLSLSEMIIVILAFSFTASSGPVIAGVSERGVSGG